MSHVKGGDGRHEPGIRTDIYNTIRINAADIADLPEPPTEWKYKDTDLDKSTYKRLQNKDIVWKSRDRRSAASLWCVGERYYEVAQEIVERPGRLSCCGGSGITNDGGDILCSRCGVPVPEEELDRVFG